MVLWLLAVDTFYMEIMMNLHHQYLISQHCHHYCHIIINLSTIKPLKCRIDSDKERKNQVYVAKILPVQKEEKLKSIMVSLERAGYSVQCVFV